MPNLLNREKSPYLLQHAGNPVHWRPWGEETFAEAKRLDRPVLVSIGYFSCHWCHVMERESFENPEVAEVLNRTFVCVKVDREERPDVDAMYMTFCHLTTGGGGWPLNVVATPDKQPFFAATYLPPRSRSGRLGLVDMAEGVERLWTDQRADALAAALAATEQMDLLHARADQPVPPLKRLAALAEAQLGKIFDPQWGGFGKAPKFPTTHILLFLLRRHARVRAPKALSMATATLDAMRAGGIRDHLEGGFHRYSTDERWLLPHFEKMLYDQAMCAWAFLECFQATGNGEYADTAGEIFAYVRSRLTGPEGGLYTAEDADSEGEEGKFHVWTKEDLLSALGYEAALEFAAVHGFAQGGNYNDESTGQPTGANIIHLPRPVRETARNLGEDPDELVQRMARSREKLLEARNLRPRPALDDKVLADVSGLMVMALALGARVCARPEWADDAARAADFVLERLDDGKGGLGHGFRNGPAPAPGMLTDYAFMALGLAELYQATFEEKRLDQALNLAREMLARFSDPEDGGLFMAGKDTELPVRQKDFFDAALPSGNSAAALALARLAGLSGDAALEEAARKIVDRVAKEAAGAPAGFTALLMAADLLDGPRHTLILDPGDDRQAFAAMLAKLNRIHLPRTVLLMAGHGLDAGTPPHKGGPRIRACSENGCLPPESDPDQLAARLA